MYHTILFDLDGTLLDTIQDLAAAGNHALSSMRLPLHSSDDYRRMVGNGIPNLVKRMLPEPHRQKATIELALTLFQNYYQNHLLVHTAPYPGISQMLQQLHHAGISLGVSSNKADEFTKQIIDTFFPDIFSSVHGLMPPYPAKPDPALALWQVQQMGGAPQSTLYIGDSEVDIATAQRAGFFSCGVTWGFRTEQVLQQAGADLIVDAPALIVEHILH